MADFFLNVGYIFYKRLAKRAFNPTLLERPQDKTQLYLCGPRSLDDARVARRRWTLV